MHICEFVDELYVLRTTQNGEVVCISLVASASRNQFVVVARPAHFVRGSSHGALFLPQFSGEYYLNLCATRLKTHIAHSAMAQEKLPLSSQHNSFHYERINNHTF